MAVPVSVWSSADALATISRARSHSARHTATASPTSPSRVAEQPVEAQPGRAGRQPAPGASRRVPQSLRSMVASDQNLTGISRKT